MTELFDPYFRQRTVTDPDGRVTRLEVVTADDLVLTQQTNASASSTTLQIPRTADLAIHADVVTVHGPLNLPGREVTILARRVIAVPADGDGPAINVDGERGDDPPTKAPGRPRAGKGHDAVHKYKFMVADDYRAPQPGHPGQDGQSGGEGDAGNDGGVVRIHCGMVENRAPDSLLLSANGGSGGSGQGGQDGQAGGEGGAGSDAWQGGVNNGDIWGATAGAHGGRGGRGGPGGAGGTGGRAGKVEIVTTRPAAGGVTTSVEPGRGGPGGRGGTGGAGGQGGKGGAGRANLRPPPGSRYAPPDKPPADNGSAGDPGPPGDAGRQGNPGRAGSTTVSTNAEFDQYAELASVEQLTMSAERARWQYLTLDQRAASELIPRLSWIAAVAHGVSTAGKGDGQAAALARTASALQQNLRTGKDFYGHEPGWVPISSMSQYADLLGDTTYGALGTLKVVETQWERYRSAVDDAVSRRDSLQQNVALASARLSGLTRQIHKNREALERSVASLKRLDREVEFKRKALEGVATQFKAAIDESFGLTADKVFDVLGTLAFWPGGGEASLFVKAAMGSSAAGQLASDTFTKTITDGGDAIGKRYVTHQVDTLSRKLSDQMADSWTVHNGYVESDDPDGYKLSCTKADYQRLIDEFYEAQPSAVDLQDALDEFMQAAQVRNRAVSDHNSLLSAHYQLRGQSDTLQLQRDVASGESAATHVPAHDIFVEGLYRRVLEDAVESVYLLGRAYQYWALQDYDVFTNTLNIAPDGMLDCGALLTAKASILHEYSTRVEQGHANLQTRKDPIRFVIDDERALIDLRDPENAAGADTERHVATVTIPAALPEIKLVDNPFAGRANVRLLEVRCWLDGLTTHGGLVRMLLTQMGDLEEIVDEHDGQSYLFNHSPVDRVFEYRRTAERAVEIETPAYLWGQDDTPVPGKLPTYTPIGPFSTWRIQVNDNEQEKPLDWSRLSSVRLEFFIRSAPMPNRPLA